jgi:hypothetical protein
MILISIVVFPQDQIMFNSFIKDVSYIHRENVKNNQASLAIDIGQTYIW